MDQVAELKKLAPASAFAQTLQVVSRITDGEREVENITEFVIRQFTFHQYFMVLAHAENIFTAIQSYQVDFNTIENDPIALMKLVIFIMSVAGPDFEALIALALKKSVSYLDTIDPEDGIKIAIAVFTVNKDFFVQRILPLLKTVKLEAATSALSGLKS